MITSRRARLCCCARSCVLIVRCGQQCRITGGDLCCMRASAAFIFYWRDSFFFYCCPCALLLSHSASTKRGVATTDLAHVRTANKMSSRDCRDVIYSRLDFFADPYRSSLPTITGHFCLFSPHGITIDRSGQSRRTIVWRQGETKGLEGFSLPFWRSRTPPNQPY